MTCGVLCAAISAAPPPKRLELNNTSDIDLVKGYLLFLADDINGAMEAGNPEPGERRRYLWLIRRHARALGGESYALSIALHPTAPSNLAMDGRRASRCVQTLVLPGIAPVAWEPPVPASLGRERLSRVSRHVHRMHTGGTPDAQALFRCASGVHSLGAARARRRGLGSAAEDPHLPNHAVATWHSPAGMVNLVEPYLSAIPPRPP
jgi:hypothetical protein